MAMRTDINVSPTTSSRIRTAFVGLFTVAILLPPEAAVFLGSLRLSAYRFLLILMVLPCVVYVLSGRAGKLHVVDLLIVLYPLWAAVGVLTNHGAIAWEAAGVFAIETIVPYMIARCFIRTPGDFERVVRLFLLAVIALIPFAMYESLTGHHVLRAIFGGGPVPTAPRLGLERAFGPFQHPILYGVFCASGVGLVLYVLGRQVSPVLSVIRFGLITIATFFSLSAGPLVALVTQTILVGWDLMTRRLRHRWLWLCGLFVFAWVAIDILSNRTPFHVVATYFTYNVESAYMRILIWQHATETVANHVFIGIGLAEWERPNWMTPSIDNFWLLIAVRYGVPALSLLAAAIIVLSVRLGRLPISDPDISRFRTGWMVTILGVAVAGATVHFWNALYVWYMFLIGSGVWMLENRRQALPVQAESAAATNLTRLRPAAAPGAPLARRPLTAQGVRRSRDASASALN